MSIHYQLLSEILLHYRTVILALCRCLLNFLRVAGLVHTRLTYRIECGCSREQKRKEKSTEVNCWDFLLFFSTPSIRGPFGVMINALLPTQPYISNFWMASLKSIKLRLSPAADFRG